MESTLITASAFLFSSIKLKNSEKGGIECVGSISEKYGDTFNKD